MTQPTYDSVWKALPEVVVLALVRLAAPTMGNVLRPWKTDIKVLFDRDLDNAFLIELDERPVLLLLEYQNYLDLTMPLRIFHYVALLKVQYYQQQQQDIMVLPIVVWATKGTLPAPVYESSVTATTRLFCAYHEILLRDLDWQTVDPLLLVLAPFLQGVNLSNLEAVAVRMYDAAPPEYRKVMLGALLNLSRRAYHDIDDIEQGILQQVRVTMDEITEAIAESPIGIKLIERGKIEGKAEGKIEGKAEGKIEGKAEGKAEGEVQAIRIFWQRRFGAMPPPFAEALATATADQLQRILETLAANGTEAEVRAILNR
jgi:hypothetical protein